MKSKMAFARAALAAAILIASIAAYAQTAPFVIRGVEFTVKGRPLPFVLRQKLESDGPIIGKSFPDIAALDAFVEDRRQVLANYRQLESVEASRDLSPASDGSTDVILRFAVVETWNIVALPQPKYDSNTGLTLYVKGRDYDFAGSLQTLNLDLSYVSDTDGNKSVGLATSFSYPFQAAGLEWTADISESFRAYTNRTLISGSSAGLTLNIPGLGFPASVSASQGFYYNPDYPPDLTKQNPPADRFYLGESLAASASIPTGVNAGALGAIYYQPSLSLTQNWWPTADLTVYGRPGLALASSNTLTAGRIDWLGNMRKGVSASVTGTFSYNLRYSDFVTALQGTGNFHANWDGRIGIAARLTARARVTGHFPDDNYQDLGGELRGILDKRGNGVGGAYVNLSLPIKLFDFPTHVIIKKNWLDFELQAQPFLDAGLILPKWGAMPGSDSLFASGGLEFLVFPTAMRNFIVRASAGWDIRSVLKNRSLTAKASDGYSPYEIYFGTGLAY
jgi:hypothetical protein